MSLFRNIVFISALAGLVAGLVMTGMQVVGTVPIILHAETYENAAPAARHVEAPAVSPIVTPPHDHGAAEEWTPAEGFERSAFTALANVATAIGFAMLLVTFSEFSGGLANWRQGIFWGLAGFAAFTVAPGLGLPPEVPGMPVAELSARQLWWIGTGASTAAGIALLVFTRTLPLAVLAIALMVGPHLIGAPQPSSHETAVPASISHDFVVMASVISLVFWVVLGAAVGMIRPRFMQTA